MALYKLDSKSTINGISYDKVPMVLTADLNEIVIRIAGEPYPFIKGKLDNFCDDQGDSFEDLASFISFWNNNFAK